MGLIDLGNLCLQPGLFVKNVHWLLQKLICIDRVLNQRTLFHKLILDWLIQMPHWLHNDLKWSDWCS